MVDTSLLVQMCKRQDPRAQRALYDQFKGKLMGICRRYAASREEAQDILQEVFIKVFARIDQLEEADKLPGWLTRIAINTAVNYYHRRKRCDFTNLEGVPPAQDNYEMLLTGVSDDYLIKAINALPDGCRIVFNLSIVEGYNHSEISTLLGISDSTSRSQLNYARTLLKQKLHAAGITSFEKYA